MEILLEMLAALHMYDEAAKKFIRKCDTGRAHSVETQADLRQALLKSFLAQQRLKVFAENMVEKNAME